MRIIIFLLIGVIGCKTEDIRNSEKYKMLNVKLQEQIKLSSIYYLLSDAGGTYYFCNRGQLEGYVKVSEQSFEKKEECDASLVIISNESHKKKIDEFLSNNPKYKKYKELMLTRHIKMAIPSAIVAQSWGKPEKINKTVFPGHTSEQWVYGRGSYVYIRNGIVSSWQSSN